MSDKKNEESGCSDQLKQYFIGIKLARHIHKVEIF